MPYKPSLFLLPLLLAACATATSTPPDPWHIALSAKPPMPRTYHAKFDTLAHRMVALDSQIDPQPDAKLRLLDDILADAQQHILWNPTLTDPAARHAMMLTALQTFDHILLQHHVIYPPTGDINLMSDGLQPHTLTSNQLNASPVSKTNRPGINAFVQKHPTETFYYMDCDILTFMYLSMAQITGLPLHMVDLPSHTFVQADMGPGQRKINWETTAGCEWRDQDYLKEFNITRWNIRDRRFFVPMNTTEILGDYYAGLALLQETHKNYPAAIVDYQRSIALYPQGEIARNNLAWLYVTIPNLHAGNAEEALQLALGALAATPRDAMVLDTVACAYAELGDFDKAVSFEKDAILLADLDNEQTPQARTELRQRLAHLQEGITYLQTLK